MRTFDQLTYEEAVAHLQAYVAALPAAAQRLRVRSDKTGGPTLDGSVDSVAPLEVWFHEQLIADADDGLTDVPLWWLPGTENGTGFFGEPRLSLRQVRLVDETAAYLAEVVQRAVPPARWEVYSGALREIGHQEPVLRGPFGFVFPVAVVYKQALGPITYGQTPTPGVLCRWLLSKVTSGGS